MALLNKEYTQKLGRIRLHYGNSAEILKAIEEAKEYINELSCIAYDREPDADRILEEQVNKITSPEEMTETKAWGLVMKAIRNSGYNSEEEFNKLPERIQKAVGSPKQLWSMATDESFNEQVASSNFMRAYRTVVNRENEIKKLSPDVMDLIEQVKSKGICVNE